MTADSRYVIIIVSSDLILLNSTREESSESLSVCVSKECNLNSGSCVVSTFTGLIHIVQFTNPGYISIYSDIVLRRP